METCSRRKATRCELGPKVPRDENEKRRTQTKPIQLFRRKRVKPWKHTDNCRKKKKRNGVVCHGIPKQTPRTAGSRQHHDPCCAMRSLLPAEYTNEDMRLRAQTVHCLPLSGTIILDERRTGMQSLTTGTTPSCDSPPPRIRIRTKKANTPRPHDLLPMQMLMSPLHTSWKLY